jgi:flagellar biosynthesis activator protein FlaF
VTALDQARAAYGTSARAIRTPRDTEHEALARVTRNLKQARDTAPQSFPDLVGAVHDNRTLWTIFAADLAGVGNGLPLELRGRLISLAAFVDAHSVKVLNGKERVDVLIDINVAVMRGLRPTESVA